MLGPVEHFLRAHVRLRHAVLVGEAPGKTGDPTKPITGEAGRRLAEVAGLTFPNEFCRAFGRVNLLDGSAAAAKLAALLEEEWAAMSDPGLAPPLSVVLLGRRVECSFQRDFGADWVKPNRFFEWWSPCSALRVAAVPHPSRVSRWWNLDRNVDEARAFFRELLARQEPTATFCPEPPAS